MKKKHLEDEENLRLQQAELMALFAELSPDPIFRFEESGRIILANNSAHKIFPSRILVGETVQTVLPFMKDYELKDIITDNRTVNYTSRLGNSYYQFIIEGVKKFNVCQVYGRDITELKHTELELKNALSRAEEAKQLKEYFLAQISHEIRAPLNVIVGYSDILTEELKDVKDSDIALILRSMKNNSKRLYRTFDLLLNMSQLQTGRYDARFEKVDLYAMLETLQADFRSLAEEKNITIHINKNIENGARIIADHYSISQVFINLIDNSIKYSLGGRIDVNVYKNESNVCVDIQDTGKGMSKEYVEKLFTPFTQEEMGYTRRYEGTGLGLAIVKSFLDINKAKVKVKSEVNNGTTFTIIFNGEKYGELK
jgi:signal transduction histidine kinase